MTTPTQDPPDWLVIRRWLPSLTQTRRRVLHLRAALERLALADLRQHLPQ